MAEVLSEFPQKRQRGGLRESKWDKYLDGQIWKVSRDEIGLVNLTSIRSGAATAAKRKGLKVQVCVIGDSHVAIQAYKP